MATVRVPGGAELGEGCSRVLRYSERGREREAFVLRRLGVLYAFINECPHWSVELDLGDGHFYDEQLDRIYCKNHGALFHVESGLCETGPCLGRSLEGLALEVDGPDVLVHLPGEPDGAAASASETP